jgi:hypothetical protein
VQTFLNNKNAKPTIEAPTEPAENNTISSNEIGTGEEQATDLDDQNNECDEIGQLMKALENSKVRFEGGNNHSIIFSTLRLLLEINQLVQMHSRMPKFIVLDVWNAAVKCTHFNEQSCRFLFPNFNILLFYGNA